MVQRPQLAGKLLSDLLAGMALKENIPAVEILDVSSNSREVVKGSLFIA